MTKTIHIPAHTTQTIIEPSALSCPPEKGGTGGLTLTLSENSHVDYWIHAPKKSWKKEITANLAKNSRCTFYFFGTLEYEHDLRVTINHEGEGAEGVIILGLKAQDKSQTVLRLTNHHKVPHTSGNIWIRALGENEARMDASCLIKIEKQAPFTDSHLHENILSLSQKSVLKTEPFLEILNNEVKCSHAATVGNLDEEAMHYLKSRGLDETQAKAMLTQGFFRALLPHITNERIQTLFKKEFYVS